MASDEAGACGQPRLAVEVVCCAGRGQVDATPLSLPAGATVAQAIEASGVRLRHPGLTLEDVGIRGKLVPGGRLLRDGDRVELYRPLQVAPMDARRTRHQAQRQRRSRADRPAPPG